MMDENSIKNITKTIKSLEVEIKKSHKLLDNLMRDNDDALKKAGINSKELVSGIKRAIKSGDSGFIKNLMEKAKKITDENKE